MKTTNSVVSTIALLVITLGSLSAQTYQGDVPGSIASLAQFPNASSGLFATAIVPTGTATLEFTIDPVALTFQFDSLAFNNLTLPTLTTTYPIGFGSSNRANVTISFNPLSFVIGPPDANLYNNQNPVPLGSVSGLSLPTYQPFYQSVYPLFSGVNLTGSYSITSPVGSASGTFSDPITFVDVALSPYIQTTGYPNSLTLFSNGGYQLRLNQGPTTLFSAIVDGTTISPEFDQAQQNIDFGTPVIASTTFNEVIPEPSTYAMMVLGLITISVTSRRRIA